MPERIKIELGSVQETLLLPLWGRAVETRKPHPLLIDRTAAEAMSRIDYDFSIIERNISEISRMAWIARSLSFDNAVVKFLEKHPDGPVVNLGCGLDTTFERIDNGRLRWYDLDLPDVIDLRKKIIPENDRVTSLPCSVFDDSWFDRVRNDGRLFFLAAGVLYYFKESEVRGLLDRLIRAFPRFELAFDSSSPLGVRMANKQVLEKGGMDKKAVLQWGLESARTMESWDSRIQVVAEFPMFKYFKKKLDFKRRIGASISDMLRIMSIVRLSVTHQ